MNIKNITTLLALLAMTLTSCDDGHVDDPVYEDTTDYYTAEITGTFKSLHTWTGDYSVAAACFDGSSPYSVTQQVLPSSSNDSTSKTLILTQIPVKAKTIEIAVVNILRKRIATIYSYSIPETQSYKDTIHINVGTLNVGMFGAINKFVFQNTAVNCSKCHGDTKPAASLYLTEDKAYKSLVGVTSHKDANYLRVKPYDADSSYLYMVLTTGTDQVHYSHPSLMNDYQNFIEIIKSWINSGAKE